MSIWDSKSNEFYSRFSQKTIKSSFLKSLFLAKLTLVSASSIASDPGGFGDGFGDGGVAPLEEVKNYGYNFHEQNNIKPEVSTLTTNLFGDRIDPSSGSLAFTQTDLSIPGNSGIPVAISRTLSDPDSWYRETREFENWSLQVPHVRSTYITDKSGNPKNAYWAVGEACSRRLNSNPHFDDYVWFGGATVANGTQPYEASKDAYWNGDTVSIPGQGEVKFTERSGSYKRYTNKNWKVECIDGLDGKEGFEITLDNGLIYTMAKERKLESMKPFNLTPVLSTVECNGTSIPCPTETLAPSDPIEKLQYPQYFVFMQVTEIRDRFNNWVKYEYHADGRLKRIHSNDQRNIYIYYSGDRISSISANNKTWTYQYDDSFVRTLNKVTRPDGKQWIFEHDKTSNNSLWIRSNIATHAQAPLHGIQCIESGTRPFVEMTHPEGMKGEFVLDEVCQGQSQVPKIRKPNPNRRNYDSYFIPRVSNLWAASTKKLTFTSGETYTWTYQYSDNDGVYQGDAITSAHRIPLGVSGVETAHLKSTTIINPDNSKTIQYFDRRHGKTFGNLQYSEVYNQYGNLMSRSSYEYTDGVDHGSPLMFTSVYFSQDNFTADDITEGFSASKHQLLSKQVEYFADTLDTYTKVYSDYNAYDQLGKITEYNNFSSNRRFTKKYYYNEPVHNLIGLPYRTTVSSNDVNYTEVSRADYFSSTSAYKSLPYYQYEFGRWYQKNESYHLTGDQAGLPKLVRYNGESYNSNSRWVEYSNYKRGKAQTIRTPRSTSTSSQYAYLVVDDDGLTTKTTDFEGNCTFYSYDNNGRLTLIDPCDSRWLSTNISYSETTGNDGLSHVYSGMQKQTINKGNYQKVTYFDSLLRPRFTKEWDKTSSATARYSRTDFDSFSRPTYQSLPALSSATSYGRVTSYDGLGRISIIDDNTTSGSVSYTYLSSNKVRVNNNRGYDTTTTYLAYGSASKSNPTLIAAPHNTNTNLSYNIFGNVTAISQGGITEHRVYDAFQHLCKTVRPDVGNTAIVSNALGETLWAAKGSSVSSITSSCDVDVNAADKVSFTYDNLGNVRTETYNDVSADKSFAYDKNSQLTTLTAGAVTTSYQYNSAQLLEKETMSVDSQSFILDYVYNSSGDLSNLIYPSGVNVAYSPNALGQSLSVGGYVTEARYHANGAVKSHKYGNGFNYESTQFSSGMTKTAFDKKTVLGTWDPELRLMDASTSLVTESSFDVVEKPGEIEIFKKPPVLTMDVFAVDHAFQYDANNNLTYWDDKVIAVNDPYDFRATYDGLDRLNLITDSYSGTGDVNYDSMGNITYYKIGNKTLSYSYNSKKQLASTSGHKSYSFQYDSKGNVTNNGTHAFLYNSAGQMYSSSQGSYVYDGNGKRVKRTVNATGKTTYSMYASNGQLVYSKTDGVHTDYYYLGKKLVARKKGSTVTYIHTDFLGSPAAESNTAGTVTAKMHYQPFGESIEIPKDDVAYTGHKFDTELGLNYMQARYYDPVIGRFYSNDPVGYRDLHSVNRYTYANNNPYKYVDPDGELPILVPLAIFLVKEAAAEVASHYSGGLTDFFSVRRSAKRIGGYAYNKVFEAVSDGIKTQGTRVTKELKQFKGTEKAWGDGATPNSVYTQVHPKMQDKAIQNSIYDGDGKVIGQVDFKPQHGAPSGHGHKMTEPGNIGSGHQGASTYVSPEDLPKGWDKLPSGVTPIKE